MGNKRLRLREDELEVIENYRRIKQEAKAEGIPVSAISSGWIKNKNASLHFKNPLFDGDTKITEDRVTEWIEKAVKDIKPREYPKVKTDSDKALRVVISDCHVGMDSDDEDALFGFKYNEKIFQKNLNHVFETVKKEIEYHGPFDTIFVDDLGDGLDGFNGETTRGGHHLPQNMTNKEGWTTYVENKLQMLTDIINLGGAKHYVFRNVSNCNHAGDWGWSANKAIQMIIDKMYFSVDYIILNRHVEHFTYGKHTFLITHGKDKATMNRGWPLHLNDKVKNLVRQYIDHYEITSPYIHVDKGDLHCAAYDRCPKFDYRNYMSFAPPSAWVQANFGVSYCGYSVQIIPKNSNQIQHTDIFFDLKAK
jgi:hypothetical protein